MELKAWKIKQRLEKDLLLKYTLETNDGVQEMLIINGFGIYDTVFQFREKETAKFRYWVYEAIRSMHFAIGLEDFQVFRMLDKGHQREAMAKLDCNLRNPVRVDFIKANTIANKAASNKRGYSKTLKKGTMSPQMLVSRESILEDTAELTSVNEEFGLGISVSKAVYQKYSL